MHMQQTRYLAIGPGEAKYSAVVEPQVGRLHPPRSDSTLYIPCHVYHTPQGLLHVTLEHQTGYNKWFKNGTFLSRMFKIQFLERYVIPTKKYTINGFRIRINILIYQRSIIYIKHIAVKTALKRQLNVNVDQQICISEGPYEILLIIKYS